MTLQARRALLFALSVVLISALYSRNQQGGLTTDFPSFYAASGTLASGNNPYDIHCIQDYARGRGILQEVYPYLYPQFLASVIVPVTGLSPGLADRLWSALTIVMFATSAVLMTLLAPASGPQSFAVGGRSSLLEMALAGGLLLVLPLGENLLMGQVNALVLVCMTVAILGLDRETPGWEWSAGAALALATLVKVTPVLLILLFVARKKGRSLGGFALAMGGGIALSMAVSGAEVWRQFAVFLPHMGYGRSIDGLFHPMSVANLSLSGFILRAAGSAGPPIRILVAMASALLAGSVLWAALKRPRVATLDGVLLAVLIAMVVISPYTWIHHLVFLYPGAFLLLRSILLRARAGHDRKILLSVLICLAGLTINFPQLYPSMDVPEVIRPFVTSMNLFFLLALFAVALRISLKPRRQSYAYRVRGSSRLPAWSDILPLPFREG